MVLSTVIVLCLVSGVVVGQMRIGSCDNKWYYLEKSNCEAIFVTDMLESAQPNDDCVTLSQKAHDCFKKKISDKCFTDEQEKEQEVVEFLDKEFGKDDHFCEDGLLYSMAKVMKNVSVDACTEKNYTDYTKCETPFKTVFKEEFKGPGANDSVLAKAYSVAKTCQARVARSCKIPEDLDTYHFFDSDEFNPYDPAVREKIDENVEKMENGETGSQTATIVTVVIVVLVIIAVAGGTFYFLHRRDISRAEIRREKWESQKRQQKPQKDTEMQTLSSEGQHNPDEISPA